MHILELFTSITMAILLSSTLSNPKPFVSKCYLPSKQHHCPRIFFTASCKATPTLAPENGSDSDFYEVLSLSNNGASLGEIKQAYRSMALRYHPDVCDSSMKEECTRIFVQLSAAYKTLSDPLLREEYDSSLSSSRKRWRDQIDELKRRSSYRMAQEEGSWGTRMRAQKTITKH